MRTEAELFTKLGDKRRESPLYKQQGAVYAKRGSWGSSTDPSLCSSIGMHLFFLVY